LTARCFAQRLVTLLTSLYEGIHHAALLLLRANADWASLAF
jgi:hypothetical protein